jgi:hypothetical protein
LTIKFGNEKIRTHPLNPLILKREGAGDEFRLKNITQLENQNSLGIDFRFIKLFSN